VLTYGGRGYPDSVHADTEVNGAWSVLVHTSDRGLVDITSVRGALTEIKSMSTTDPFGPAAASLVFPALTMLDSIGEGDLSWWRPGAGIDIVWSSESVRIAGPRSEVRWEGYIAGDSSSMSDSSGTMEMTLKGALLGCDNTLAMPEYQQRPYTFEYAVQRQLDKCRANGVHIGELVVRWPQWWSKRYVPGTGDQWWMVPVGVSEGDLWTGMVTRETGQFEPAMSNYINGLLQSMHTEQGQFTLMLDPGRVPVLMHRDRTSPQADCEIDLITPGVAIDLSCDYETKANVVYGSGRGLDGIAFSNMQFYANGGQAYYTPFAYHPSVHPPRPAHIGSHAGIPIRREVSLKFYEGMSPLEAARASELYRQRFSAAGWTGQINMTTDPYVESPDGSRTTFPRHALQAGDSIRVPHLFGRQAGALFHVTQASHDIAGGRTTLTVDTVFRDRLTSDEVRLRGRDALTDAVTLTTGQYTPNVRDQMLPWGPDSGYVPVTSRLLFDDAARDDQVRGMDQFPWEEATLSRPPSDPRWESSYVRIPAADREDLRNNWNCPERDVRSTVIQLAQAGSIQLLQVMAVDRSGRRMKVPFHISFYMNHSVTAADMPKLDGMDWAHPLFGVKVGPYPFFPGAWEQINTDGSKPANGQLVVPAPNAGMIAGWGTQTVPAGYHPGDPRQGQEPTGLLSVQEAFSWDVAGFQKDFNPYQGAENSFVAPNKGSGIAGVMIYCDSEWDERSKSLVPRDRDVYFIARLFRAPPGNG
jgi:hypothetical protein